MRVRAIGCRPLVLALAAAACAWAGAAWAQAAETAAAAGKVADTFLSRGEYGAVVVALGLVIIAGAGISGAVIRFLYNENKALNAKLGEIAERAVTALSNVSAADDRDREVLQGLRTSLDTRAQALSDLSTLVNLNGTRTEHGLAQVSQVMTMLAERFKELRDDLVRRSSGGGP